MSKTLPEMTAEVMTWCRAKGWYDTPVTFPEAMALLHSEVSEAVDAFRVWRLTDATKPAQTLIDRPPPEVPPLPKPEGVASELADTFIRLLDDVGRWDIDLAAYVARHPGRYAVSESFVENMDALHVLIARASEEHAFGVVPGGGLAAVYVMLGQVCEEYGIDLEAEYERKMAYNWTRAYRHGQKVI